MGMIEYPQDVVRELNDLRQQSYHAVTELFKLEREQVEAEIEADKLEATALLGAEGTIPERQAWAKLKSLEARKAAEMARIKVNYAKNRIKQLSESTNAVQTASRMIELQWKVAGVER
jgi:hypothetical protein